MCHVVNNTRAVQCLLLAVVLAAGSASSAVKGAEPAAVQGFSEPYRVIRVAGVESGVLKRLFVQDGEEVSEGRPLAELDTAIHKAMLEIAKASRDARGDLDLARAEHRLRQHRLDLLLQLHKDTFASDEETRRARTELEVAAAQLRSAEEKQLLRKLEFERLAAQLEARTIRAPQDGVVTIVHKQCGEYVGPNDAVVVTMVQLQPLSVVFLVPRDQVVRLNAGQSVGVFFPGPDRQVEGIIEFVAPIVDAGSGTVTVRLRVDNLDRSLRAGEPCELLRDGQTSVAGSGPQLLRLETQRDEVRRPVSAPENPLRFGGASRRSAAVGKKKITP
jgi:RND family efflux transporter MFP subunit